LLLFVRKDYYRSINPSIYNKGGVRNRAVFFIPHPPYKLIDRGVYEAFLGWGGGVNLYTVNCTIYILFSEASI